MRHIRYMTTETPLCVYPEKLGKDFVVTDIGEEPICTDCSALLFTHNQRAFEKEMENQVIKGNGLPEDPLSAARGVIYGLIIGSFIWLVIFVLVWAVFFRG